MALVTGYGTYVVNKNRKEMKGEKGECKCKKGEGCGCGKKEGCKSHCGKKQSQTECLVGVME